ncbi:hypothetical protein ECHHL_0658 [Ehrlichia chaffeensis str. Heartland]|nr:hypothetical protein ECHHL_0658 [Ehrlichia chaffeensis str. Heartland]
MHSKGDSFCSVRKQPFKCSKFISANDNFVFANDNNSSANLVAA